MPTELEQIKNMISIHMEVSQRRHDESQKMMRDLSVAVVGDEKLGVEGMVKRVDKLEKADETRKKREWMIFGAATLGGFSLSKIGAVIGELFSKH